MPETEKVTETALALPALTEEEKKRKKREDAKVFFEAKKKQKQEEKEARAAAIARGETPPEPEKPKVTNPLQEPPLLAPHVKSFYTNFWDPTMEPAALKLAVQQLIAVRQDVITQTEVINQRDDIAPAARRKAMKNVLADRLQCNFGSAAMAQLAADPTVQALRKGVAKSIKAFIDQHPDWFDFVEETHSKTGKAQQMVYLAAGGGYSEWALNDKDSVEIRSKKLLVKMGELLEANGGAMTVSKLGEDHAVRQLRKGCASSLAVFIRKHTDYFSMEESETTTDKGTTRVLTCHMVSKPPALALTNGPAEEDAVAEEGAEEGGDDGEGGKSGGGDPWQLMMKAWSSGGREADHYAAAAMAQFATMMQYGKGWSKGGGWYSGYSGYSGKGGGRWGGGGGGKSSKKKSKPPAIVKAVTDPVAPGRVNA